jgi:outer membrane lipoprotein-sorting protein
MMKLKYLFLLFTVVLFCGCSEDDAEPVFTLQNAEVVANAEGGEYTVTVTSTSDWTVSEGAAWVATEISTTKDKLVLKVNENLEKTDRSLTLTLTNAENLSQTVSVKQGTMLIVRITTINCRLSSMYFTGMQTTRSTM